jgi:hypothetical protein
MRVRWGLFISDKFWAVSFVAFYNPISLLGF